MVKGLTSLRTADLDGPTVTPALGVFKIIRTRWFTVLILKILEKYCDFAIEFVCVEFIGSFRIVRLYRLERVWTHSCKNAHPRHGRLAEETESEAEITITYMAPVETAAERVENAAIASSHVSGSDDARSIGSGPIERNRKQVITQWARYRDDNVLSHRPRTLR